MDRRRDFESTRPLAILFVVTGTGPSPIGRPFAQLPTDRILVDVGNRGFNGLHRSEVPIITSAFLPESKNLGSWPLQDREPFQQRAPDSFQEPLVRRENGAFSAFRNRSMRTSWDVG